MGEFFLTICEHHGLPLTAKKLFKNMELIEFLYKPVSMAYSCFLVYHYCVRSLIIDMFLKIIVHYN